MTDQKKAFADRLSGLSPEKRQLFEQLLKSEAAGKPAMTRRPADGPAPLSFAQQRLWFLQQLEPGTVAFNLPITQPFAGPLDVGALETALGQLAERHEVLRTRYIEADGTPFQVVDPPQRLSLHVDDLTGLAPEARQSELRRLIAAVKDEPFDLSAGAPFRARLLKIAGDTHVLSMAIHHIAYDLWSASVLSRELAALYAASAGGRPHGLPPLPIQYADFARWQRETMAGEVLDRALSYWRTQLQGAPPVLPLPIDRARPALASGRGERIALVVPPDATESLRALTRREHATMFMTLLAAFQTVLHWYSGSEDVVVGSPIANRKPAETEQLIGLFLNNLVLRGNFAGDPTFTEVLRRVRKSTLDALAHGDLPFERLVEELQPQRALNIHPLFQVMFTLQTVVKSETGSTTVSVPQAPSDAIALDVEAYFDDGGESIGGVLAFSADLFESATMSRMTGQLRSLLLAIAENPDRRLSELSAMAQTGERGVRERWNDTRREFPGPRVIHELVAAQAERTPNAAAVEFGGRVLTYADLQRGAGIVAARLRAAGIGAGSRVGVYMDRSENLPVALLGILAAGAAYVPLDPAFPVDRISYMIADARAAALLVDVAPDVAVPAFDGPTLSMAAVLAETGGGEPAELPAISPEDIAYVIYTSGSTGRPKGVQVPHRAIVNFLHSMRETPGLTASDRLLAVTTLSFDIAGLELFLPLVSGATVVVARKEQTVDPLQLTALLESSRATVMQATPATWRMLHEGGWPGSRSLRVLCGGEALPPDLGATLASRCGDVWNLYGPTETTIWSTVQRVEPDAAPTIGRPIANTRIHLLDRALRPVPIGAPGEIFIAGDGVARGYLDRPELTAERFVPDAAAPGARMYRTGDLARFLPDGRIQYLERIDHQVKLRGFRIELGEIEAVLAAHPGVAQAVARVREDVPGDARLVAYIVASGAAAPPIEELKVLAGEKLPQYMHPSAYVVLESLPLTPNGKVDRNALPAPERGTAARDTTAPRSELEQHISEVWREVLRVEAAGIHENFFDLGGHSLLLVQVQKRLLGRGHRVAILDLFQYPTVAALARHLAGDGVTEGFSRDAAERMQRAAVPGRDSAIAIVGMAGRFPGAADLEAFWQNLRGGVEGIRFFSDEELKAAGVADAVLRQADFVKARGPLDGADLFDAGLFRLTPREADLMDPQHRVFLECAWEALDRAACDPQTYDGAIGVFAGSSFSGYVMQAMAQGSHGVSMAELDVLLNADKDHMPTRVSYKLNLRGPSLNIQTACSTSLVAVHVACRSLLAHECDTALAGGVSVGMSQVGGYIYVPGNIASPDGHCRPFDASGAGIVGGNGVGIVVLKRLADAVRDGNHIHAVVRGTAINNDGSGKIGYTAPSIDGQSRVIAMAQAAAGCAGDTIGFVEAHGTATPLGDPIEVKALTQVFGESTKNRGYCAIGSVKSNIGHLDAAAGVAGFIKAALVLEHREIPPTLHFEKPNPEIDFDSSPFYVNTTLRPWTGGGGTPRRAAVSSFGLGGTNAHAVLEEAPAAEPSAASRGWQVLPVSARTEAALDAAAGRLAEYLERHRDVPLADVAFTLSVGRQNLEHRRAVVCRGVDEALEALKPQGGARSIRGRAARAPKIAFLFPGQGSQYRAMAAGLYADEEVFRREFDRCAELFGAALRIDLRRAIDAEDAQPWTTALTQAALFATEYALARLWMSWGVTPDAMLGHSIGEYVAAALSGALPLGEAIALVIRRSELMDAAPAGAMLAVMIGDVQARPYLEDGVSLAAHNSTNQCVLSGSRDALERAAVKLAADGVESRWLATAGAFHSALMDGVIGPLTDAARNTRVGRIDIPYVSNVTGTWITAADLNDPTYWARHARGTVEFCRGSQALLESGIDLCLEVGPGQTLGGFVRQAAQARELAVAIVPSLPREQGAGDDRERAARALAQIWVSGRRPGWEGYFAGERRRRLVLPAYPFERRRHWLETPRTGASRVVRTKNPDLTNWFFTPEWQSHPAARLDSAAVPAAGPWLVFGGDGADAALVEAVKAAGGDVVLVERGARFEPTASGYRVNPTAIADFVALVSALRDARRLPGALIHAWAAVSESDVPMVDLAFGGLMLFVRAAGEVGVQLPRLVWTLTAGVHRVRGDEPMVPEAATALGPALVIPAEHEGVLSRTMDLVASEWRTPPSGRARALLAALLDEATPAAAAFRHGRLWMRSFHQQRLAAAPASAQIKSRGVYLITGGYGGIGLELGAYLAEIAGARLVLTGREGLPERSTWARHLEGSDARLKQRIAAVEALERAGAEVVTFAADVTDPDAMRRVVDATLERFGGIDGAIHAAGIPGARVMQLDDGKESAGVLAPKLRGTKVLLAALERTSPAFVVLCSSINTIAGGIGQSAYTAANAYLDAVARAASDGGPRVIAINWDAWQEVGMAVNTVIPDRLARLRREELKLGILSAEGREAFARILSHDAGPQVIVSTREIRPALAESATATVAAAPAVEVEAGGHERPELTGAFVAPRNPIEEEVADVWRQLFGLTAVGVDDDFFELGGHSLLATQVMSRVRARFQVDLGIGALFEEPTIAGLSMRVMEQLLAADADALGTSA